MAETTSSSPSVAVLVVSCDKYSDLWAPFFTLLDRFWRQRPGPVYLLTNEIREAPPGVRVLAIGPDRSWSDNLLLALSELKEDYVLMLLEDLFFCGPVNQELLGRILAWAGRHSPGHVRLFPLEKPPAPHSGLVGRVPPGAPYRTTTMLSLWRRDLLSALLKPGEDAWQFELNGTVRSDAFDDFYSSYVRVFSIVNGVIKGKWDRFALKRLRDLGVRVDPTARPIMSLGQQARYQYISLRSAAFKVVPWQWRREIRRLAMHR